MWWMVDVWHTLRYPQAFWNWEMEMTLFFFVIIGWFFYLIAAWVDPKLPTVHKDIIPCHIILYQEKPALTTT